MVPRIYVPMIRGVFLFNTKTKKGVNILKLKEILNLGATNFAMRANLPTKEVALQEEWTKLNMYHAIQEKNAGRPTYVLHDGPPYANGKLYIGHALNNLY